MLSPSANQANPVNCEGRSLALDKQSRAGEHTPKLTCPCGVVLERRVSPQDAELDLLRAASLN
jgi:hypothetical protein